METHTTLDDEWPFLLTLLPADLEASAREWGAFERQREIQTAADLLRLALVYGFCGRSLRDTTTWAGEAGVAELSAPALFQRLRRAADWLGRVVWQTLAAAGDGPPPHPELRLQVRDATVVRKPGSTRTDFRLHLEFDLRQQTLSAVELTAEAGGETFERFPAAPGTLVLGDAAHSSRAGIAAIVGQGGEVIVRHNWHNVPLQQRDGTPFDLWASLRGLGPTAGGDWEVQTVPGPDMPAIAGRLVALRKSPAAIEAARRRLRRQGQKHGSTPSAQALEAVEYVLLFTTLAANRLEAAAVLELYRFRWQIELAFKRLKSLFGFAALPAKDDGLGRTFLLAKILGALLIDRLSHRWVDFSPWGYGSPAPRLVVAGAAVAGRDAPPGHRGDAAPGPLGDAPGTAGSGVTRHPAPETAQSGRRCPHSLPRRRSPVFFLS
jgi:hypothetical protein